MMRIGIAADHAGFALKVQMSKALIEAGHEIIDFGPFALTPGDDFPDYVVPLAQSVAAGGVERGVAICGSGVGASIAANKVKGVRAALVSEIFSAHQGVEDDDMNVICLGGSVLGFALARELTAAFLASRFKNGERHRRRLKKIADMEK